MKRLFVYSGKDMTSFYCGSYTNVIHKTWHNTTKAIDEIKNLIDGDVHTTQMYALRGAQDIFDEIYIDKVLIWPNEKQKVTDKELRPAHDLCRLFAPHFRYDGEIKS